MGMDCFFIGGFSGGHNLASASDLSCNFGITADPLLGVLKNNGGPTETHAISVDTSPAVDAGDPSFCPPPATDQRGVPRDALCDIGAFEFVAGSGDLFADFLSHDIQASKGKSDKSDKSGKSDKSDKSKKSKKSEKVQVALADQFVEETFKVEKLEELVDSADESGDENRLTSYKVKGPKFERVENVLVSNALGDLEVDVKKPTRLFVPVEGTDDVDHFLCYDVKVSKGAEKFPKGLQAFAVDQADDETKLFDIKKPKRLCNPVEKTHDGATFAIENPDDHLMCYSAKLVKDEPKHKTVKGIMVEDQFGEHKIDVKKERELCFISTKTL